LEEPEFTLVSHTNLAKNALTQFQDTLAPPEIAFGENFCGKKLLPLVSLHT
jgi:hypothetical protein